MTQNIPDTFTLGLSIFGSVISVVALVLGVLNYRRDRAAAKVLLTWDMAVTDNPIYDSKKRWGLVRVTNVGRRPLYLGAVALELPKGQPDLLCGLMQTVQTFGHPLPQFGARLSEGDPPAVYVVDQDEMKRYASHWKHIRARAEDSTGKIYRSKPVDEEPSWAKPIH